MSGDWPLGLVELKVLDLERESAFYESFGLSRISGDGERVVLGAGDLPLLRLVALPGGRERPRHTAGLFHFAIRAEPMRSGQRKETALGPAGTYDVAADSCLYHCQSNMRPCP